MAEVASKLGWWTLVDGVDHLVEDSSRIRQAVAAGMVIWDPGAQRYIVGDVDVAALDQAGRDHPAG